MATNGNNHGKTDDAQRKEREKSLELAVAAIEKQFGRGSIMRLGEGEALIKDIEAIPTGSLGLDIALGIGGMPRGRVVEIYGPESSGSDLSHLTEPFYRGGGGRDPDPDRNPSGAGVDSGGFGLGLAFVAFVAKALGGELRLDNSSGGLLAVLTLPIVAPA